MDDDNKQTQQLNSSSRQYKESMEIALNNSIKFGVRMEGSFNLFRAQLKAYLSRYGAWGIVLGELARDPTDAVQQAAYDKKDLLVRDTLLRSVKQDDAERICDLATPRGMWDVLDARHTKREYSNYVHVKKQLYTTMYARDQSIDKWLSELDDLRRQLYNLGKVIDDDEMVEIVLAGVILSHCETVRQFSRTLRADNNVAKPNLEQVKSTLLSESEIDSLVEQQAHPTTSVLLVDNQSGNHHGKQNHQRPTKDKRNNKKARRSGKCHYCGKAGHWAHECRKRQNDLKHGSSSATATPATYSSNKWTVSEPSNGICTVKRRIKQESPLRDDAATWILDSGSCTHVCCVEQSLSNAVPDTGASFEVWNGSATSCHLTGDVNVLFINDLGGEFGYRLNNVRYARGGRINILSLDRFEREGWQLQHSSVEKKCWLRRGDKTIVFNKNNSYYTTSTRLLLSQPPQPGLVLAAHQANSLDVWHRRFAHLHEAAIVAMAACNVVDGLTLHNRSCTECYPCLLAKAKRMSYHHTQSTRATSKCSKFMTDLCYVGVPTVLGKKYFQLIEDEYTRYKWGYLLENKKASIATSISAVKKLLAQGNKIDTLASDQGGEFVNKTLLNFLGEHGIHAM